MKMKKIELNNTKEVKLRYRRSYTKIIKIYSYFSSLNIPALPAILGNIPELKKKENLTKSYFYVS